MDSWQKTLEEARANGVDPSIMAAVEKAVADVDATRAADASYDATVASARTAEPAAIHSALEAGRAEATKELREAVAEAKLVESPTGRAAKLRTAMAKFDAFCPGAEIPEVLSARAMLERADSAARSAAHTAELSVAVKTGDFARLHRGLAATTSTTSGVHAGTLADAQTALADAERRFSSQADAAIASKDPAQLRSVLEAAACGGDISAATELEKKFGSQISIVRETLECVGDLNTSASIGPGKPTAKKNNEVFSH
jgi:hypothetical protein